MTHDEVHKTVARVLQAAIAVATPDHTATDRQVKGLLTELHDALDELPEELRTALKWPGGPFVRGETPN